MQVCQMYLKSNMDRFIVIPSTIQSRTVTHLKSNMDRFIDYDEFGRYVSFSSLKSNMDRFIVSDIIKIESQYLRFKIQYG